MQPALAINRLGMYISRRIRDRPRTRPDVAERPRKHRVVKFETKQEMYTNLVFSGGGLACFASFACANALKHKLRNVTTIVGTSAGSLVAALMAMEADEAQVYSQFIDVIGETKPISHVKVTNIFETFGSMNSDVVTRPIITKIFMESYNMAEICRGREPSVDPPTFKEFAILTGKNLIISAVNVSRGKPVFFSVDTHPDQDVVQAIMASCSVPILLSPVKIDGDLYVDAGITDNLPLAALKDNFLPHQTLAIDTFSNFESNHEISDLFSFFRATLLTVMKECNKRNRFSIVCDRIEMDAGEKQDIHIHSLLGTVDQATLDNLYTTGIHAAKKFEEETFTSYQKTTDPEHK